MSWYNSDFTFRKKITLTASKISGSHTDFPLLFHSDSDSNLSAYASSNGKDIIFTTSDGVTRTHHEIENWSNGSGNIWVRAPSLTDNTESTFYLYYGDNTDHTQDINYKPSGVWDTHYMGVWHMKDSSSTIISDSTIYENSGSKLNATVPVQTTHSGQVGYAQFFNNQVGHSYINLGNDSSLSGSNHNFTVELWYKYYNTGNSWNGLYCKEGYDDDKGYFIYYTHNRAPNLLCFTRGGVANDTYVDVPASGVWHHLTCTYDGTTMKLFSDFDTTNSSVQSIDINPDINTNIGARHQNNGTADKDEFEYGLIDEVRFSDTVRDNGWILTSFRCVSSNSLFLTLGAQEVYPRNIGFEMANEGWYDNSLPHRKKITLNGSHITGSHTDFPWLFGIETQDSDLNSNALSNGKDIIFTESDGITRVHHEIENWSSGSGAIWVRAPSLTNKTDATLYLYYGDGVDHTSDSGYLASGVWDINHRAVYHLNNDPTGDGACILDSTTHANHATPKGSWSSDYLVNGAFGGGKSLRFSSQRYIDIGVIDFNAPITYSAWGKPIVGGCRMIGRYYGGFSLGVQSPTSFILSSYISGVGVNDYPTCNDIFDNWHRLTLTYDRNTVEYYLNSTNTDSIANKSGLTNTNSDWEIGTNGNNNYHFTGQIDEVRISDTARSAGWIFTSYSSMNSPSNFFTLGSEEDLPKRDIAFAIISDPSKWYNDSCVYRKKISISGAKISGNHTDFPMLVHIDSDSDLSSKAHSGGKDIIFTTSDGVTRIHNEIENFLDGSGNIWVRIPTMTDSTDDYIWMYYGDGSDHTSDTSYKPSGVWDNKYVMVLHMDDETSSMVSDSTTYQNDANKGGTTTPVEVDGIAGKSQRFYASDCMISAQNDSSLAMSGALSLEAWVQHNGLIGDDGIVIMKNENAFSSADKSHYDLGIANKVIYWQISDGTDKLNASKSADLSGNTWHYIVGTWNGVNGSNTMSLYLDGVHVDYGNGTIDGLKNLDEPVCIGGYEAGAFGFSGCIDEVRITSGSARTPGYVLTTYRNISSNSTFIRFDSEKTRPVSCIKFMSIGD